MSSRLQHHALLYCSSNVPAKFWRWTSVRVSSGRGQQRFRAVCV